MTKLHLVISLAMFALLPVIILLLRAFGPRWFGAWMAILIIGLVGWLLANASIYFSFEDACEIMARYGDNPPRNVIENCTSDSAPRGHHGVLFGGIYALIYYAPFALAYYSWDFWKRNTKSANL